MRASLRMGSVIYMRSIWPALACSTSVSSEPETGSLTLLLASRIGSFRLSSKKPSRSSPIQGALARFLASLCPSGPAPAIATERVLKPFRRRAFREILKRTRYPQRNNNAKVNHSSMAVSSRAGRLIKKYSHRKTQTKLTAQIPLILRSSSRIRSPLQEP